MKINNTTEDVILFGTKDEKIKTRLMILGYIAVVLLLTFLLTYITYKIRISTIDMNSLIYSDLVWSKITLIPLLFLSLCLAALPYELIEFRLFGDRITKKEQKSHLKLTYIVIIIAIVVTIPIAYLLFDFYTIITPKEIIKDNFLSLNEKRYSFDDISSIAISGKLNKVTFKFDAIVNLKNGDSFDLFSRVSLPREQEINVIKVLKQNNVPIIIGQLPSQEDFDYIASLTSTPSGKDFDGAKESEKARRVFEEIKNIVNN